MGKYKTQHTYNTCNIIYKMFNLLANSTYCSLTSSIYCIYFEI